MEIQKSQYQIICDLKDKYNTWIEGETEMVASDEYKLWEAQREIDCQKAFEKVMLNPFYLHLKEIGYNIMLNPNASYDSIERISIALHLAFNDYKKSIFKMITEKVYLDEL